MAAQRVSALFEPEVDAEEAERTIEAHFALRQHLIRDDHAWLHRGDGLLACAAEVDCTTANAIHVHDAAADAAVLASLIGQYKERGRRFSVNIRGGLVERFASVVRQAGLSHLTDLPMMAVLPDRFRPAKPAAPLRLRLLRPEEPAFHLDLVAEGLEMSRESLARVLSAENRALPSWSTYVGEVNGALAVTGTAVATPEGTGLICIATDPGFGRRGFGGALTSRAIEDAFARGAPRVLLHSSAQGFELYRRLGFKVVEHLSIFGLQ